MVTLILLFLAGMFEGVMDTLQFHWSKFRLKHKKANSFFWSPELSWKNKYKDGQVYKGEKFFGSTTIFVGLTDGWHLMKLLKNICIFVGIFFCFEAWWIAPIAYAANRIGFNLVYKKYYK